MAPGVGDLDEGPGHTPFCGDSRTTFTSPVGTELDADSEVYVVEVAGPMCRPCPWS